MFHLKPFSLSNGVISKPTSTPLLVTTPALVNNEANPEERGMEIGIIWSRDSRV